MTMFPVDWLPDFFRARDTYFEAKQRSYDAFAKLVQQAPTTPKELLDLYQEQGEADSAEDKARLELEKVLERLGGD